MTDIRNHRRLLTAVAATSLLCLGPLAGAAAAAEPTPLGAQQIKQARTAAEAPQTLDTLARFFARDGKPPTLDSGMSKQAEAQAAAKADPKLTGPTVAVYALSPDFVRGTSGAPVADLDVLATKAVSADGKTASVWSARQGGAWQVVNIASGSYENDAVAKAAESGTGGTVFQEPQIRAWYVQRGDRVIPLNAEARSSVGKAGTSIVAYQKLVQQRYGDKLPGSAYDREGMAGGYSADPVADSSTGDRTVAATTTLGASAAALIGLTAVLRRRRRAHQAD
ncbi:hypothetical protein [Streptomyces sp. NPDC046887]|uniref:hypothetical protein n=1 Tax=Streptomyces sp. NPDC046887 TaxID=3155472 RepID=UPI0033C683B9